MYSNSGLLPFLQQGWKAAVWGLCCIVLSSSLAQSFVYSCQSRLYLLRNSYLILKLSVKHHITGLSRCLMVIVHVVISEQLLAKCIEKLYFPARALCVEIVNADCTCDRRLNILQVAYVSVAPSSSLPTHSLLSDVSTHGTDLGKLIREDFWLIVTIME